MRKEYSRRRRFDLLLRFAIIQRTSMNDLMIAGVDEAGRGPLAGSVVAAAVILDPAKPISGLTDSKKLSEKKRIALEREIRKTR